MMRMAMIKVISAPAFAPTTISAATVSTTIPSSPAATITTATIATPSTSLHFSPNLPIFTRIPRRRGAGAGMPFDHLHHVTRPPIHAPNTLRADQSACVRDRPGPRSSSPSVLTDNWPYVPTRPPSSTAALSCVNAGLAGIDTGHRAHSLSTSTGDPQSGLVNPSQEHMPPHTIRSWRGSVCELDEPRFRRVLHSLRVMNSD